jgi:hypothetical protein
MWRTLKMEIKISCPHCKCFLELHTFPEVEDSKVVDSKYESLYAAIYTNKDGSLVIRTARSLKPLIELIPTSKNEAFIFHLSNDIVNNIRRWNQKTSIWEDFSGP